MSDRSNLKRIKNYIVSMEEDKLLGRGRMGEVRMGISQDDKKLLVFKIVLLPLSQRIKEIVEIQQKLNSECVQTIQPLACSSTKCYIPYQHLPFTLKGRWDQFKGNVEKIRELCSEMFYCYSYFVGLGLGHGNIKAANIGFTKQGKLKFTDLIPSSCYEDTLKQDMVDFGQMLLELCGSPKPKNDLAETLNQMMQSRITWSEIFNKFGLIARLTKFILEKNDFHAHNRARILLEIAQNLGQNQNQAYLACSIYVYIKSLLKQEIRSTSNRSYQKILTQHLNKIQKVVALLPQRKYFGIVEAVRDRTWFQIDVKIQLQILMCLIPWVNHQYIHENLVAQASEEEMEVIVKQYSTMVDFQQICAN